MPDQGAALDRIDRELDALTCVREMLETGRWDVGSLPPRTVKIAREVVLHLEAQARQAVRSRRLVEPPEPSPLA